MRSKVFLFAGLCSVLLWVACSPGIDKNKFVSASRAAGEVQGAIASGVTYQRLGELLQGLAAEIAALHERVKSRKERELAEEYSQLLKIYQDGFLLWRYRAEFSGHDFVPKGRIYVGQDVEPIVTRYRLSTESHIFGPTRQSWKSISENAIRIVWFNADAQRKKIDMLLQEEG